MVCFGIVPRHTWCHCLSHPVHSCTHASRHDKAGILGLILMPKVIKVMLSRSAQGIWVSLYYLAFPNCPSFDNIMWLHNNSDRKRIRHRTGNPGEAPTELSELVTLLHEKSGKKQTCEHLDALQSPTHFSAPLPLNKPILSTRETRPLKKWLFSPNQTLIATNELFQSTKKLVVQRTKKVSNLLLSAFSLSQNNPEVCLFDPWLTRI